MEGPRPHLQNSRRSVRAKFDFNRGNEDRNCRIHPDEKTEVKSDQLRENCTNASILESPLDVSLRLSFLPLIDGLIFPVAQRKVQQ